jgi:hypothetical protein
VKLPITLIPLILALLTCSVPAWALGKSPPQLQLQNLTEITSYNESMYATADHPVERCYAPAAKLQEEVDSSATAQGLAAADFSVTGKMIQEHNKHGYYWTCSLEFSSKNPVYAFYYAQTQDRYGFSKEEDCEADEKYLEGLPSRIYSDCVDGDWVVIPRDNAEGLFLLKKSEKPELELQ